MRTEDGERRRREKEKEKDEVWDLYPTKTRKESGQRIDTGGFVGEDEH